MTMAPNMYHWISSHAFELMLKPYREKALPALTRRREQHQPVRDDAQAFVDAVDETRDR